MTLQHDIDAFLKSGKKIQNIPKGQSTGDKVGHNPLLDAEELKARKVYNKLMSYPRLRDEIKPTRYRSI